jgi:hypothetical protein
MQGDSEIQRKLQKSWRDDGATSATATAGEASFAEEKAAACRRIPKWRGLVTPSRGISEGSDDS